MSANPIHPPRPELRVVPVETAPAFGPLLAIYRKRVGLSQNQLARSGGCDPAYVNRLERDLEGKRSAPSRRLVLSLWQALQDASLAIRGQGGLIGLEDRERLLVAAGLVPEVIIAAGGWTAYSERMRQTVLDGLTATLNAFDDAQHLTH